MSASPQGIPEQQLRPFRIEDIAPKTKVLGMLGLASSGKTVFSSVLAHILPHTQEETNIICTIEEGQRIVGDAIKRLTVEKLFPKGTLRGEIRSIKLRLSRKRKHLGKKNVILHINDITGETFEKIAAGDVTDPRHFLLTQDRKTNEAVGPYSFLLYANALALTIDCAEYADWEWKQHYYTSVLDAVVKARQSERLNRPLALVFTKSDMLPREKWNLSPSALLSEMPGLRNYAISKFGDGNVQPFKVNIEIERDENGNPVERDVEATVVEDGKEVKKIVKVHIPKTPLQVNEAGFRGFAEWAMNRL